MKTVEGVIFEHLFDHGSSLILQDMSFVNCTFAGCVLSMTNDIARRSTIRNLHLKDCQEKGCGVGPAIFEDCSVDGLATSDLLITWGALFRRVSLSGKVGKIKINKMVDPMAPAGEGQRTFDLVRETYYADTDWALDISRARFKEFDVRGIPACLFRLDLETQAIVTRERAMKPEWRDKVSSDNRTWPLMVRLFLQDGDEDLVLVVPLDAPKQKRDELIRGLKELRDLGVAEPL